MFSPLRICAGLGIPPACRALVVAATATGIRHTFSGAASTTSLGTADTGEVFQTRSYNGIAPVSFGLTGTGEAYRPTGSGTTAAPDLAYVQSTAANGTVAAAFALQYTSLFVAGRIDPADGSCFLVRALTSSTLRLYRLDSGQTLTQIGQGSFSGGLAGKTLEMVLGPGTVAVAVSGVLSIPAVSDAQNAGSVYHGFGLANSTDRLDSLTIT